mmetsp:Transcript_19083/g.28500  ORF Transcript_19083/g.28500 Transcript_19083/m.28500 type:complete len:502 (-) Transcript_19083:470-1975(-)
MESTPAQAAEGMAVVRVLAAVLDRLVGANAHLARADPGQVTKFHALKAPGIGIMQYLERIHKYASCSTECFILALIYIDRLIQRNNFLLTELNVHRVVITAVLLAAKFFDDAYYNNAYYAKVGGVLVSEMNSLEVEFLFRINFSLKVSPELFQKYHAELVSHAVGAGLEQPTQPETPQVISVEQPLYNASQNVPIVPAPLLVSAVATSSGVLQQPPQVNNVYPIATQNGDIKSNYEQVHDHYTGLCSAQQVAQQITPSPPPHPSVNYHDSMICQDSIAPTACTMPTSQMNSVPAPATAPAAMLMSSGVPPGPLPIDGLAPPNHHFSSLQRHHSLPPIGGFQFSSTNPKSCLPFNGHVVAPTTASFTVVAGAPQHRNPISYSTTPNPASPSSYDQTHETEQYVIVDNVNCQHEHQFLAHYQHSGLIHHRHDQPHASVTTNVPVSVAGNIPGVGVYHNGRRLSDISYHTQIGTPPSHIDSLSQHFVGTNTPPLGVAAGGGAFS